MALNIAQEREKARKVVEDHNFDALIMFLICLDAVALGLLTLDFQDFDLVRTLFLLDRLCMAIFIVEMLMKMYAYGPKFFKSGWNVFDLTVITISALPVASYLIIMRTFRLFRLLRYAHRCKNMQNIINIMISIIPSFLAMTAVLGVFLYVFAILAVGMFGSAFVEFGDLGTAMISLLQSLTISGWTNDLMQQVLIVYPNAWLFFLSFALISGLVIISFFLSVIAAMVHQEFKISSNL